MSHVILPTPLAVVREDEGSAMADWLDAGLAAVSSLDVSQPVLATVAVSESALADSAFDSGGLLEALVDHVTSREDIDGAYVVVVQTKTPAHPFEASPDVIAAYLRLTNDLAGAGLSEVVVNYADVAGIACIGLGATMFATGPSTSLRRCNIEAYKDKGGGIPLPQYYSHRVGGEFSSETDMEELLAAGAVRRIRDLTEASAPLLAAWERGETAAQVAEWAESRNNLTAAHFHYILRMIQAGGRMKRVKRGSRRAALALGWIERTHANQMWVSRRLNRKKRKLVGRYTPVEEWGELFEDERDRYEDE